MTADMREHQLFKEARDLAQALRRPGSGVPSDGYDVSVSPDGTTAVFAAAMMDSLEGLPATRIAAVDLASGELRIATFGPNLDRLPRFAPDRPIVAFLSDRAKSGDFQLHLLDLESGAVHGAPAVEGWVEAHHWSPDGKKILLMVAGHGADVAGGQGAVTSSHGASNAPDWLPTVETGDEDYRWRSIWIYDVAADTVARAVEARDNVWEAAWCGNDALALVTSPGPDEGEWYHATLVVRDLATGRDRAKHRPVAQLGLPAASPDGQRVAFVEAVCSDRGIVAGDLWILEPATGQARTIDTAGIDVTHIEWRSDTTLLIAGHRGFDTVVALCEPAARTYRELWSSGKLTSVGRYAIVAGIGQDGDFAILAEGFFQAPELAVVCGGAYRTVRSLDTGYADVASVLGKAEPVRWKARDGLEIQGWLLLPKGEGPHPLVMNVHGGPVWHSRPTWLGRWGLFMLMLLGRGYAIFLPNPRGSSGRGTPFTSLVVGDMGGEDTHDLLSGLDHLVAEGIADPDRLGVTGVSYGGFMTSWLVTQTERFKAAVPVAPVTNQVTEHLISNIPTFVSHFLQDELTNTAGKYFTRSPVMYAHQATTPTLNMCGALDRCTPPEEAVQFHRALREKGVKSALVTYPLEGHGVRHYPAALDYAARVVDWFVQHIGAEEPQ